MKYSVRYNRSLDLKSFDEIIIELKDEKYEELLLKLMNVLAF